MATINMKTYHLIKTGFVNAGFTDYIASRFLLNNGFFEQGVMLACYAVERYMKALLLILGVPIKDVRGHIDRLDKFERLYGGLDHEYSIIISKLDTNFLKVLKVAYGHRYYDDIKSEDTFGFLVNQFLGELDYTVFLFDNIFNTMKLVSNKKEVDTRTAFAIAATENNRDLLENNHVLHGVPKIEFMNRESYVFSVYINTEKYQKYILSNSRKSKPGTKINIQNKFPVDLPLYEKQMFLFEMTGKSNDANL